MKNKHKNIKQFIKHRPFHLHLEYFFRLRVCLIVAAAIIGVAVAQADQDVLATVPHASAAGVGYVGSYLSEERLHPHSQVHVLRMPTVSGE